MKIPAGYASVGVPREHEFTKPFLHQTKYIMLAHVSLI
jgi:hypothetical protein